MPKYIRCPLVTFLCLIGFNAYSQAISVAGKEYPATKEWSFLVKSHIYDNSLAVRIGKTEKGGLLQLTIETSHPQHYIGGTVYLFLEDNSIITCTDKQMRKSAEKSITSWYVLTEKEMKLLGARRITDIRFAIEGQNSLFSGRTGHFTAINKKQFFDIYDQTAETYNDTAVNVRALYN